MTDLVPEAAVERAAKAIAETQDDGVFDRLTQSTYAEADDQDADDYRRMARAALSAALPVLREEGAVTDEGALSRSGVADADLEARVEEAAHRIRSQVSSTIPIGVAFELARAVLNADKAKK